MDVFDAVRTVLAVRRYADRPVAPESVRRIVEAGRLTGSSQNKQPWHFVVVQERETLRRLGALVRTGRHIADAQLAVVVVTDRTDAAVSDASRAIQSMFLAAWAEGIGSNWTGFFHMEETKPLLGIPDDVDVFAILPFGYPADEIGQGKKHRKPLSEVAHAERWGEPYS